MLGIVLFFGVILGALPFLPDATIDAWHIFNPRKFALLMAMIAGIQFGGHLSIRWFGNRLGMAVMGLFGGFISSTAVFANLPHTIRAHPHLLRAIMAAAIFSIVAMQIEITIILATASPHLLTYLIWPLIAMTLTGTSIAIFLLYTAPVKNNDFNKSPPSLHILSIIKLTLLIGGMIALVSLAKYYFGTEGTLSIAFLGGLFEIHSVTLAIALLFLAKQLTANSANLALATAIFASFLSKYFLLFMFCPRRFAIQTSLFISAIMLVGGIVFLIAFPFS